ncbi:uncharacterized protein LOC115890479 [Sitophilus oryzae]|uniref:Uncharacterized protein LOC115890479 n=1 Tax=Sitophilus oryzae TaxID=7048 RepID=A0A6J2YR75_SITOR|nr:uncharacterized protein LOC115890479 [Sitophilus oryzae]
MDESGLSIVQRPSKSFATKGRKQVGTITSAEHGAHTTVVYCMNTIGSFIPPAMIFARKNSKPDLTDHAPAGTLQLCQESGWMTGIHKYLPALEYAKRHGVVLLCTPPHCTHRIQPLDVSFFGPLSNYYNQAITKWIKTNPARTVTAFQVGQLFSEAYEKAAVMGNAVSGFKTTGIYSPNPDIFPEWMFSPSDVTNLVLEEPSDQSDLTEPE